jgi:L-arabinose isomerase
MSGLRRTGRVCSDLLAARSPAGYSAGMTPSPARIGLFGIGLDSYWPQFDGLHDRLIGYLGEIRARLERTGAAVTDAGLVDNPARADAAAALLKAADVDLLVLFISTYALSSTVLPVVQAVKVPVVVLNMQPVPAIDYAAFNALGDRGRMTGEWLAHCQACSVPEIASVFGRARIDFHIVTGHFQDDEAWGELDEWVRATGAAKVMRHNRLGVLGHYYQGMLDVYTDMTVQSTTFGTRIDLIEIDELRELRDAVSAEQVDRKLAELSAVFDVSPECEPSELERAARTSVALDLLVERHGLGSLAYYYEGTPGSAHEDIVTSVIAGNTLLTGRNVPVAGECEIKNAQAMKLMDALGAGGSFSEFYAMDFTDGVVMLGHDGPAHLAIAEGRVGLVPLPVYHGKPGKGLSIQMTVRHGPVTLLSVCHNSDGVFLLVAEGESVPGPVLQIGNTNSRYRFPIGVKDFINRWSAAGPSHHCAIGVGRQASVLAKVAALFGIPVVRIC